jgi:hypothetical protein
MFPQTDVHMFRYKTFSGDANALLPRDLVSLISDRAELSLYQVSSEYSEGQCN